MRMIEPGQGPGFAHEPLGERRIAGDRGRQDLDRDQAIELGLPGLVDGPHATLAEQGQHLELGEATCQFGRRRWHEPRRGRAARRGLFGLVPSLDDALEQARRA
jgi:hypothetical protein